MTILRSAALALLFALPATALADHGVCPWSGPLQVDAKMTWVSVNGLLYDVQGPRDRDYFAGILQDCGATEAAIHFARWRNARIATNATAVGGVVVDDRIFLGTLAGGLAAGAHKRDFRKALSRFVVPEYVVPEYVVPEDVVPYYEPGELAIPEPDERPRQPVPAPGY